jgi:hypothetical protein
MFRKADEVSGSRKLTNNFNASVKPLIENGGKYDGKVKAIIRQQVQPWHGSSTFVHEVALAVSFSKPRLGLNEIRSDPLSQVARVSPQKFWEFHLALMNGQEDFYDIPSSSRTPSQTRAKLIDLALPIVGADKKEALTELLTHKTTPNGGTAVTDDLKYTSTCGFRIFVREVLPEHKQSSSPVRTRSMSPQPFFGMVSLLVTFPAAGVKRSGLLSWNPRFSSR